MSKHNDLTTILFLPSLILLN